MRTFPDFVKQAGYPGTAAASQPVDMSGATKGAGAKFYADDSVERFISYEDYGRLQELRRASNPFHGFSTGFQTLIQLSDIFWLEVKLPKSPSPGLAIRWRECFGDPTDPETIQIAAELGIAPPPSGYLEKMDSYRLSFVPVAACARDFSEIFIAGHPWTKSGVNPDKIVIERWKFKYPDGYPTLTRSTQSGGMGVSTSYSAPILGFTGATPLALDQSHLISEGRQLIYYGEALKDVKELLADPDGRFLDCLTHGDEYYRIDFDQVDNPILLASSGTAGGLSNASNIYMLEHATHGRVVIIPRGMNADFASDINGQTGKHARTALVDSDNDGVIDSQLEVADGLWGTSGIVNTTYGLDDESLVIDGFVTDVPCDM